MTDRDHLPDASPLDELASSVLDGEATADEQARAADPEVTARIAAFRAVSRRVAEPVAPPAAGSREAAIAAALAAADRPGPAPAHVVALAPRRRAPRWLPAAAAVAAVLALGALVAGLAGKGDDDADTAAGGGSDAAEEAETFDTSAAEGGAAADSAPIPAPGAASEMALAVPDLGDLDAVALPSAVADLRTAAAERTQDEGDDGAVARDAGIPCADRFGASLVAIATARVDEVLVTVGILDDGEAVTYVALDQADCERQIAAGRLE